MKQTHEEMIAMFKKAGIENAERLVSNWTWNDRANNISQIMRLMIDSAFNSMQRFVVPFTFPAAGKDAYDVAALMEYVYKLSCLGIMPEPFKDNQS